MTKALRTAVWTLVALAVLVRVKLLLTYDILQGYDGYSHLEYLQRASLGVWPTATQFWQGYQPPGYYFLSSWAAWLLGAPLALTAQVVTLVSSVLIALPIWWLTRKLIPGYEGLSVLFFLSLPNLSMLAPMIYGLPTALLSLGLFLVVLSSSWDAKPGVVREIGLGLLLGLTCLVRLDGLMLGLPVVVLWLRRWVAMPRTAERVRATAVMVLTGAVALALISPMLLRNLALFNTMFVTNRDANIYPNPLTELNMPGFIPPSMVLNPGWRFWLAPGVKHMESLPGTLFVDLWGGAYPHTLPGQVMLVAGLCSSLLAAWGLWSKRSASGWGAVRLVALTNLLLMSVVIAEMRDYSALKACYFYGLYPWLALGYANGGKLAVAKFGELGAGLLILLPSAVFLLAYSASG